MAHQFYGDNPYVLVIVAGSAPVIVDLDEPGWATTHADLMRKPGAWTLTRKSDVQPVLSLRVQDGEQPYYTAKVVGVALLPPPDAMGLTPEQALEARRTSEVRAYGIGKKRLDGHVDRLWIMPSGVVCGGDDVTIIGEALAKANLAAAVLFASIERSAPLPVKVHP